MSHPYYTRPPPTGPEIERLSSSFAKLFRSSGGVGDFPGIHSLNELNNHHQLTHNVITQQPFGSQISNTSSIGIGIGGGIPLNYLCQPPNNQSQNNPHLHHQSIDTHSHSHPIQPPPPPPPHIGIPLPGLNILDRVPFIKVSDSGIFSGSYTCSPTYKIFNLQGELILRGITNKLFCPFDSRMKSVALKDSNDECIFQIKFTPSICECDSEEKRCFAVFSPLYDNPFGAILFEAGQIKYSLRILNALEGETFAVQFISDTDISIKGADGTIVAIINILKKRGEKQKYTLTLTEEISTANKALFTACIITLDLVSCESTCSKCICLTPFFLACLTIFGLTMANNLDVKPQPNPKP